MQIDGYTLFLIFFISACTGALVSGFLWLVNREIKGLGYWFWSQLLYALAVPLAMSRFVWGETVGILLANSAYFASTLLFVIGHVVFLKKKHPVWFYTGLIVGFVSVFSYYYFVEPNTHARTQLMSGVAASVAMYFCFLYWEAWRYQRQVAYLFALSVFLISFTINVMNIMHSHSTPPETLFDALAEKPALYIGLFIVQLVQLFAHFSLVNAIRLKALSYLADHDSLTDTHNRRSFMQQAERIFNRAQDDQQPLSVLMIDVDWFKTINDRYGHHIGDETLRALVQQVKSQLRPGDLLGRYGGEEFCVLLESVEQDGALKVAERIRKAVENNNIKVRDVSLVSTVSIGVSGITQLMDSFEQALQRADEALYQAKDKGRNQVCSL
ncbi:GGDEF domain-containing protein [Pleionea sp. CnH1-48]|uniref:GGDEF domain-containing protein n=1 Tax=Pleionea sp. CnH1-48 TaxID=2954494 RepID=UPI002096823F|nr:GGDEF domain-containing protein [Pleionea sp. CnH1-48]MCO7223508.1 GGDEF domain-containing protein [Pleionea sp. CnH1-48]